MHSRQELARIALRASFDVRRKAGVLFEDPLCIYDISEKLDLEVWFVGGSSFGGMYAKDMGRLFVPSERPAGRKAFTCAHELGHWWFDHGSQIDSLDFDRGDNEVPQENLVNLFSSYLLMPRHAVVDAFKRRQLETKRCTPNEVYAVACQLGVGYSTLLKHMRYSLNLLDHAHMTDLSASSPKNIRDSILGIAGSSRLVLTDRYWRKVAIDLEVGDHAIIPHDANVNGSPIRIVGDCAHGAIVQGRHPGIGQAIQQTESWAAMIRVSRKQYIGRGAYRHLEDPDEISYT